MSEPLSQVQIEQEILRLSSLAEGVTNAIAERARDAAVADSDYKRSHAAAFLMTSGTVGEREAQTHMECADAYLARRIAEALLLAEQESGRNIRAQLDALRSINANLRSQVVGG